MEKTAVTMKLCDLSVSLTHSERQRLERLGTPLQLELHQLIRVLVHNLLLGAIHEDCTISSLLPEPKLEPIPISLHLSEQQLEQVQALSALSLGDGLGALAQALLEGALTRPQLLAQLLKVSQTKTVRLDAQQLQRLRHETANEEAK